MSLGVTPIKQRTGRPVRLSADGYPERPPIGITVAWNSVTPAAIDTKIIADDTQVYVGERVLRVGTLMVKITSGQDSGKYGPFKADATDGRQSVTRGDCMLVDYTIKQGETSVWNSNLDNDHIGGVTGGMVWRQRLKIQGNLEGVGTDPTFDQIKDAFPRLEFSPVE